jgi:hypothetical protein
MRQIQMRELKRCLTSQQIRDQVPFELLADGEVIALVMPVATTQVGRQATPAMEQSVGQAIITRGHLGRQSVATTSLSDKPVISVHSLLARAAQAGR